MTLKEVMAKVTTEVTTKVTTEVTASGHPETLWLLEKATGQTYTELRLADENTHLSPEISERFLRMLEERRKSVPLQYILEDWDFMGLTIKCRPGVLIPRRDTEILAEEAIKFLRNLTDHPKAAESPKVLDLCTGSGCIGIAIAAFCPDVYVTGTDISDEAIKLARENAAINNLEDRVTFVRFDVRSDIKSDIKSDTKPDIKSDIELNIWPDGRFSCITANPPYIPTGELPNLPEEVRQEPALALDGGPDGLDFYRVIIPACSGYLLPGGSLFMEIGSDMGKAVTEMFRSCGFRAVVIIKDLEGRDRVVQGTKMQNFIKTFI